MRPLFVDRLLFIGSLICSLLLVAACGSSNTSSPTKHIAPTATATPITYTDTWNSKPSEMQYLYEQEFEITGAPTRVVIKKLPVAIAETHSRLTLTFAQVSTTINGIQGDYNFIELPANSQFPGDMVLVGIQNTTGPYSVTYGGDDSLTWVYRDPLISQSGSVFPFTVVKIVQADMLS